MWVESVLVKVCRVSAGMGGLVWVGSRLVMGGVSSCVGGVSTSVDRVKAGESGWGQCWCGQSQC